MVDLFIFIPLMGVGLRRVRYLALAAQKQGEVTDELRDARWPTTCRWSSVP